MPRNTTTKGRANHGAPFSSVAPALSDMPNAGTSTPAPAQNQVRTRLGRYRGEFSRGRRPRAGSRRDGCAARAASGRPSDSPLSTLHELRLRGLELRTRAGVVDLLRVDGVVDERERPVLLDLEEAGAGRELEHLLLVAQVHPGRAGLQHRDERRVPCEHADLAGRAGDDQHLGVALEGGAVRRHEGDAELPALVGHYAVRARPRGPRSRPPRRPRPSPPCGRRRPSRPRSTASSIVPTM